MKKSQLLLKIVLVATIASALSLNSSPVKTKIAASSTSCTTLLATSDAKLSASQLEQKVSCLQQQQSQNQQQLNQTQQQEKTLQSQIGNINSSIDTTNNQISNTSSQINATNAIIAQLGDNISQTQAELDGLNNQLKTAYQQLYEMSQTSVTDLIFQGASLNTMLSQSQYIESLQTNLQANIAKANQLKTDLQSKKSDSEKQQANLSSLNNQLQQNKSSLNYQVGQKTYLLQTTQGQEASYQALITKLSAQIEVVSNEAYKARLKESSNGGETITGGTGGYPWASASSNGVDPWLFYYRQCTSYGAWKFDVVFGKAFDNTRPGNGDAWNWPALASDQGYHTSKTPRANALVSWPINRGMNMDYGHIAWVDSVNSNGTINIEEYNWTRPLGYDMRTNVDPLRYGSPTYIYP